MFKLWRNPKSILKYHWLICENSSYFLEGVALDVYYSLKFYLDLKVDQYFRLKCAHFMEAKVHKILFRILGIK